MGEYLNQKGWVAWEIPMFDHLLLSICMHVHIIYVHTLCLCTVCIQVLYVVCVCVCVCVYEHVCVRVLL